MEHPAPTHASAPPAHSHGQADHAHVAGHIKRYIGVGLFQIVMTCFTVWVSFTVPTRWQVLCTLLSASLNAIAVAAILMHLKNERALIWRVLFLTIVFFIILFFLTLLYWSNPIMGTSHTHH